MLFTENKIIFIIAAALVTLLALLGFIFFVIYRNIRIRQEKEVEILDTMIQTQNFEQNRIAEDLHDELSPLLSAIKLQLNNMKDLTELDRATVTICSTWIDKTIEDIRLISRNLSYKMIVENGLVPSIEDSISLFARHSNVKFETTFIVDETFMSDSIKSNLYKILIELVNNTIKHSNSNRIEFSIIEKEKNLHVEYSDNGTGAKANKKGLGSLNFLNRLKLINGSITQQSKDFTNGAHYYFTIPIESK